MTGRGGTVWFVVPEGVDEPDRVSGGNVFDLRVRDELRRFGWDVRTIAARGDADAAVSAAFARVPDGALVLVDGLVALGGPAAFEAATARLRVVLLAHMVAASFPDAAPRVIAAERRIFAQAPRVVVTSAWARDELIARALTRPDQVRIARPGTDRAAPAAGTPGGRAMLCVGAVVPHKGQDTLVAALAGLDSAAEWTCTMAGSIETDRGFASDVAARAEATGLSQRIAWPGVLAGDALDAAYDRADLLVAPSRTESYGMAIAEALRRGIPVIASDVGGVPEAVRPGTAALLVPPGRPDRLAAALRRWMTEPALRAGLTAHARRAGSHRAAWCDTARAVHRVLEEPW